jgi:uncharacterized BrkB/YihY/UPF0761 family membrane protein
MTVDPAATPPNRNRQGWDITVTIIALLLNGTFLVVALFFEVYGVSFIDVCPNDDCSGVGNGAFTAFIAAIVAGIVFTIGTIVSILLLVKRRRGWWVAVGSGVIMVIVFFVGVGMAVSALQPLHEHPRSDSSSNSSLPST